MPRCLSLSEGSPDEKGLLMKTTTITLAVAIAVSSWFTAAEGAYHRKKGCSPLGCPVYGKTCTANA
jgi:hypothetical protein